MNRITSLSLILAVTLLGLTSVAAASDTIAANRHRSSTFELLPVLAPWTGTSNPGALSEYSIGKLSLAQAGYTYNDDKIRFIQQPEATSAYHAATKGFMQLGKLSLFGSFRYSNDYYRGSEYNGTLMFNSLNPYLLGDTVPAVQFKEQFDMEGKVSYRLSDRLTVAAGVEYLSAVGAKQKDPRNRNTISSLKLTPGMVYDFGKTKIGISGSVYTTSNEISYSVEGNWNQTLFVLLGLGYYRQEVNISSYSEWYTGKGYSGAIQASHESDNIYMVTELKYDYFNEEARTGSSFRLIDGITGTNDLSLSGLLRIDRGRAYHLVALNGSLKALNSDEILQRSFTVNKGTYSYDSLATVSWIKNKHMITDIIGTARYSYLVPDNEYNIRFEAGATVTAEYFSTDHYPVQSYGFYNVFNLSGSLFALKMLRVSNLMVTPRLEAGYRMNISSDIAYNQQLLSIPEMVYHDYFVIKSDVLSASASVRLEIPFSGSKFIKSLFFVPECRLATALNSEAGELSGYMIRAVTGIIF